MYMLSAIVWFGLYLHHAVTGATVLVNNQPVVLGDLPGEFTTCVVDIGDTVPLTYGFSADGLVGVGDDFSPSGLVAISYDAPYVGTIIGADGSGWWRESFVSVVLPEPEPSGVLLCGILTTLIRGGRRRGVWRGASTCRRGCRPTSSSPTARRCWGSWRGARNATCASPTP